MRRSRRSSLSVLSISGRQLNERMDAPLRNASVQLLIQTAFMMVYTFALTNILLRTIQLPVDSLTTRIGDCRDISLYRLSKIQARFRCHTCRARHRRRVGTDMAGRENVSDDQSIYSFSH